MWRSPPTCSAIGGRRAICRRWPIWSAALRNDPETLRAPRPCRAGDAGGAAAGRCRQTGGDRFLLRRLGGAGTGARGRRSQGRRQLSWRARPPELPRSAGKVKASVLVLTGADDPLAPPEQVAAFENEMRAAEVRDWQVISYGNTLHGFTNPAADGSMMRTALYNAQADRRSWAAMRAVRRSVGTIRCRMQRDVALTSGRLMSTRRGCTSRGHMFGILGLGFLLGMQHALEADHIAAVSSIAARRTHVGDIVRHGLTWGLGHTLTLFVFAGAAILLGRAIPESVARPIEAAVGIMLVGLGAHVLWRLWRDRVHFHRHGHGDGTVHIHAHSHAGENRAACPRRARPCAWLSLAHAAGRIDARHGRLGGAAGARRCRRPRAPRPGSAMSRCSGSAR